MWYPTNNIINVNIIGGSSAVRIKLTVYRRGSI